MIAYLLIHGTGPLYLVINFLIYLIVFAIVWLIFRQIAGSFGISPQILNLIGLLLFLLLVLSLFVGCANSPYENTVGSRSVGVAGAATSEGGSGKVVYTVTYR